MKRWLRVFPRGLRRQTPVLRSISALCLLLAAWTVALPAAAETLRGVVIVVIDGDTVLFKPDHTGAGSRLYPSGRAFLKIRLADIDAPEKDQPFGEASSRMLSALVLNQMVEIHTVATDAYGRSIAHLQKDTLQINTEMVRMGLAWASARYRRNPGLADAQLDARNAKRGLWADTEPTPPWVWRRAQK